jgi:hypothetical protein
MSPLAKRLATAAALLLGCSKACRSPDAPADAPLVVVGVDAGGDDAQDARTDASAKVFSAEDMRRYAAALKQGRTLTLEKKYAETVAAFDAALAAIPDEPHATAERGYAKLLSGDTTHAEMDFWRALKAAPMADKKFRAQVYFNLGLVNEKQGDDDEAQSDFRTSYEYNPTPQAKAKMSPCPAVFSVVQTEPYATRAAAVAALDASDESPTAHTVCPEDGCHAVLPIATGVVSVDGVAREACYGMDPADCSHIEKDGSYWVIETRSGTCSPPLCGCEVCLETTWDQCEPQCADAGEPMTCGTTECAHAEPHAMMWIDATTGAGLWSVEWDAQFNGQITATVTGRELTVTGAGCNVHRGPPKPPN